MAMDLSPGKPIVQALDVGEEALFLSTEALNNLQLDRVARQSGALPPGGEQHGGQHSSGSFFDMDMLCGSPRKAASRSRAEYNFRPPAPPSPVLNPAAAAHVIPPPASPADLAKRTAVLEAAQWMSDLSAAEMPATLREPTAHSALDECEAALHLWLKSGEVLCAVVNRVRPGSVSSIATGSGQLDATGEISPFERMENISRYLSACGKLGMPAQDLFEASDLYEGRGMRAVVRNLHSLGRIAQKEEGFNGPSLGARLASRNERHFSEKQLAEAKATPKLWNSGRLPLTPPASPSKVALAGPAAKPPAPSPIAKSAAALAPAPAAPAAHAAVTAAAPAPRQYVEAVFI